jgi:hypothetical protein
VGTGLFRRLAKQLDAADGLFAFALRNAFEDDVDAFLGEARQAFGFLPAFWGQ